MKTNAFLDHNIIGDESKEEHGRSNFFLFQKLMHLAIAHTAHPQIPKLMWKKG